MRVKKKMVPGSESPVKEKHAPENTHLVTELVSVCVLWLQESKKLEFVSGEKKCFIRNTLAAGEAAGLQLVKDGLREEDGPSLSQSRGQTCSGHT